MESVDLSASSLKEKVNLIFQKNISNEGKMDSMKSELCEKISTLNENLTKQINQVDNSVNNSVNQVTTV